MKKITGGLRLGLAAIGVVCILFPGHVTGILPFLLGGGMLLAGLIHGIGYLKNKGFLAPPPGERGQDIILVVMGIAFLWKGSDALGLMGVTWGLMGLRKATEVINETLRLLYDRKRAWLPGLDALIRLGLSLALLFDPFEKFAFHIVLLGLELVLVNVKLPRRRENLPPP